jgi:hypothetical protein
VLEQFDKYHPKFLRKNFLPFRLKFDKGDVCRPTGGHQDSVGGGCIGICVCNGTSPVTVSTPPE